MESSFFSFILCLPMLTSLAQIPNGNFEEWETIDNIESPKYWQTNNNYENSTPVDKVEDAIEGNYSMKISSTALDVFGTFTQPGCAHIKFLPPEIYRYMTAAVRIDSIEMGEIAIRVKQRAPNGLFEKIGEWARTTLTTGVSQVVFPVEQTQLDTLLIEIWAFNSETVLGNIGYSEAIIDNLSLMTTVATKEAQFANSTKWLVSPNPAKDMLSVQLDQMVAGTCQLRLLDLQGRVRQEHEFQSLSETTLDLGGLAPGVYLLEMTMRGMVVQRTKVVLGK